MPAACAVEMIHSVLADPRRPAGHGRRRPAAGPADLSQGVRRSHGDPGGRRTADAGLRGAGRARSSRPKRPPPAAPRWRHAAGAAALVGGQADDLAQELAAENGARDASSEKLLAELESIHRRKTGAMFLVSLAVRGSDRRGRREADGTLDEYGRALGLAFQIVDDLLDVQGDERGSWQACRQGLRTGQTDVPRFAGRRRKPSPRRAFDCSRPCDGAGALGSARREPGRAGSIRRGKGSLMDELLSTNRIAGRPARHAR